MAWYLWVDDNQVTTNCSDLSTLSEKSAGFQGGKAAVAKNVNVALRQANLVACALMDVIDSQSVLSYSNSRQEIAAQCTAYFNKFATLAALGNEENWLVANANNAQNATNAENANNATNATNADNATHAIYAQYASTDTSKGTIEERLTNLGFKKLPTDRSMTMHVSGAALNIGVSLLGNGVTTREGNRTQIGFRLSFFASSAVSGPMLDFLGYGSQAISTVAIPAEYRPKFTSTCAFDCQLQYVYANGLSVKVHACMNCTIYGADTENAGKIALQVVPPNISGLSTTLSQVNIISTSSRVDTGYSSKAL